MRYEFARSTAISSCSHSETPMTSRFTHVLMAAALALPLFAGAAVAQTSAGPGPNSASSGPIPANSLPMGGQAQGQGANTGDGRIVLNPAQSAEAAPMAAPSRRMTRQQTQRARQRARARRAAPARTPMSFNLSVPSITIVAAV